MQLKTCTEKHIIVKASERFATEATEETPNVHNILILKKIITNCERLSPGFCESFSPGFCERSSPSILRAFLPGVFVSIPFQVFCERSSSGIL
jgi:hypothetical protein